jgi:two-component system, OmpR family, sensor histidine kinase SenX3
LIWLALALLVVAAVATAWGVMQRQRWVRAETDLAELNVQTQALSRAQALGDEALHRLQLAAHQVLEGVVVCDEQGVVVWSNKGAQPYLTARHADVVAQRTVVELLDGATTGRRQRETVELYGPPRRTLQVLAIPLEEQGRIFGAVAVIDDITDRRRLEAVRRDFVANVSHELKTPVGALTLLAETLTGEDDLDVIHRLSERLLGEGHRLARIIEDLLDLSRIESDDEPRRELVPVRSVVGEAVEWVRPLADAHSIHLDASLPGETVMVLGERRQLVSALSNLLENAVKYSDAEADVELRVDSDDAWIEVVVRDSGIGIPERELQRIFERFYRVDPARARDTGGTGLGLAIVRHVAQAHGGEIVVDSLEGRGSTFTLRLPTAVGSQDGEVGSICAGRAANRLPPRSSEDRS